MKTKNPLKKINEALGANGIILIVVAAVLLIVIYIVQYNFARKEINEDLKLRAESELSAKSLAIQSMLIQVETAVKNHIDDATRQLNSPDSMYNVVKSLVSLNPILTGSAISFVENYFPSEGKWFEAYAVRDSVGNINTMQLGSEDHDYFKSEFFTNPVKTGQGGWSEPYLDSEGAKMMLTTYSEPIYDNDGKVVAVLDADISLDWLDDILKVEYAYPSSYHVLLSKSGHLMSVADKNFLMKTIPEMGEVYGNKTFAPLNEGMMSGKSGETQFIDKKGNKYMTFYMPVEGNTGWSIAIINSEKEIFGDFHKMRVTLLWLSIAGFVIFVLVISRAIINIRNLERITTEREKIRSELNVAREIQMGMLPKNETLEAVNEKIDVAGSLDPAKEVGGDLYDFYIRDHYLYFCIGDVSGKGVPASLFMTVGRSLFRTLSSEIQEASKIMTSINRTLSEINESNMFITLFLGVLNLETGRLNYSNAGHDAPVILDGNGVSELKVIPNLPLGIFSDFDYTDQTVQLRKDSLIFLYTDGLTEAMNSNKEEFGEKRMFSLLKEIYSQNSGITPKLLLKEVRKNVNEFVGKAEQSDDLTMLAFRFHKSDNYVEKAITLTNDIKEISKLNKFVTDICQAENLPAGFIAEIKLAIEEVVVNCINYAYDKNEKGSITVSLKFQPKEMLVEIKDNGKEFDPTFEKDVDLESDLDQRQIGGLGLFLVKQLTDTVTYRRAGNFNILSLTKIYDKSNN